MSKIQKRLKAAYENVEFYSDKTWNSSFQLYQRANQELLARETKLQDAFLKVPIKRRTVQDSIPNSKLAQYGNYEYNESRELCYSPSLTDIVFYYPCTYSYNSIREPWMLPETEQLFIWLTYSHDFDLLSPIGIEELDHLDERDTSPNQACSTDEVFHQIHPLIYNNTERTPGKYRYTQLQDEEQINSGSVSKIIGIENTVTDMRINSDRIKKLWNSNSRFIDSDVEEMPRMFSKEKKFNIFKSPLGNYFVFENVKNVRNIPNLLKIECTSHNSADNKVNDLESLENLTSSFVALENWVLNEGVCKNSSAAPKEEVQKKEESVMYGGRRLYSAVLQGLSATKTPPKIEQRNSDHTSLALEPISVIKQSSSVKSSASDSVSIKTSLLQKNLQCSTSCSKTQSYSYQSLTAAQKSTEATRPLRSSESCLKLPTNTYPNQNLHMNSSKTSSSVYISSNTLLSCPYSANVNPINSYNTNYFINMCSNNSYLSTYTNNNFYINTQNSNCPAPSLFRQTANPVHINQPLWVVHQQSTQMYYPVNSPPPIVYMSSPQNFRSGQRWSTFLKPPSPQTYHMPPPSTPPQQWIPSNPNIYRSSQSTQQYNDYGRANNKVKRPQQTAIKSSYKDGKEKSEETKNENGSVGTKVLTSHLEIRRETFSEIKKDTTVKPVCSSVSEDLEKQALEQYRSSNENFIRELELQAAEQYDYSENSICPPNDFLDFGGHLISCKFICSTC